MVSTNIWVGLKFEKPLLENEEYRELHKKVPKGLWNKLHVPESFAGSCVVDGISFQFFNAQDNVVGFGAPIFRHAWESGPQVMDLKSLEAVAQGLKEAVSAVFRKWNFQAVPETYLMEDSV